MRTSHWITASLTLGTLLVLLPIAPSQAQTCVANGSDLNCTNTGHIANFSATNANNPGTTTGTNSGSVDVNMNVTTAGSGSATAINSGSVGGNISNFTNGAGTVMVINSGRVGGTISNFANGAGTATTTNSGSVGLSISNFTNGPGTATTTNSGSVGQFISNFTNGPGTATVTNSGSVSQYISNFTNGPGTATVTNSGYVGQYISTSTGNGAATVINSGTVAQDVTASVNGSGLAQLINSGAILQGVTLNVNGVGASNLTILPGSFIIGGINLKGTSNTVVMNAGNQNLTITPTGPLSVTGNVPFVFVGNRIVSLDPTSFAVQSTSLNDFARGVSSAIPELPGGVPSGGAPLAFAAPDASARIGDAFATISGLTAYSGEALAFKNPTVIYSDGSSVWARGFGGTRIQRDDGALLPARSQFYGGMLGGDIRVRPDLRIGAFVGLGNSQFWTDYPFTAARGNPGNGSSDIAFGGAYAQYDSGATFLRAALQVGSSRNWMARNNINNNTVPTGLENANASFNGWYVSPEATLGHRFAIGQLADAAYTLTPSLRLRYLYGSFDGFTETGTTTAPLTMGSRTIGTMEERGELKLTRTVTFMPQTQLSMSGYGGVQGTQRAGDSTLNGAFLGQAMPFASPGAANVWGGFGGGGLEWRARNVTFYSAGEYLWLSDHSTIISGRGGIRVSF